jgi:hypothetical protein
MENLKHAKELAEQILEMTRELTLSGEKENEALDVENYLALLDEREPLVDELSDLRLQISDEEASSAEFIQIKKIISMITEMDKKHIAHMETIRKDVQSSYKGIKQGQRIHKGYSPLPGDEVSSKIDMKQ